MRLVDEYIVRLVTVIDSQVVHIICRDIARELQLTALWCGQHEGAIAAEVVAAVLAAIVIDLEPMYIRRDSYSLFARLWHVDKNIVGERRG